MFSNAEILIVEDSPTQLLRLQALLESTGCRVLTARNGVEALQLLADHHPTLVISDIVMPEMDGYALCRQIKNQPASAKIPVLLMTTLSDPSDVMRGLASGADNFIVKPFNEGDLFSRLRYFLANLELRAQERGNMGIEIILEGKRHFITAERQQILDLLISTYEQGISLNQQLREKHTALTHNHQLLNCLFDFTSRLSNATSERTVIETAMEQLPRFPAVSGAWLLLAGTTPDDPPRLAGQGGRDAEALAENIRSCLADCTCRPGPGQPAAPTNILDCPALKRQSGGNCHARVPVLLGGDTIGVLNVLQRNGQPWPAEALEALGSVGHQLAMALARARLFERMEQGIQDRTRALAQSEALLKNVLEHLPVGILVTDRDGNPIISNRKSDEIWHFMQGREGETRSILSDPARRERVANWRQLRAVLKGNPTLRQDFVVTAPDGRRLALQASAVPLFEPGNRLAGAIGMFQDVTERRQLELDMQIRTQALEASHGPVMITDHTQPGDPVVYVNPAFEQMTGYSAAEALGRSPRFLMGSDVDQPGVAHLRRAVDGQAAGSAVLSCYRKDGSCLWVEVDVAPVVSDNGSSSYFVAVLRDITSEKRYQEELEHQANHDSLTGLPNRNLLNDRLAHAIAYAASAGNTVTVVLLDIDHFKVVNDGLGHDAGDRLLATIARRLQGRVREIDTVARLGGDEFAIVLPDTRSPAEQSAWLERLIASVAEPMMIDDHELVVGCSIGLCSYPVDGTDATTLLRKADIAMYRAKDQGRNSFCAFTPEMNQQMQKRLVMEREIRHALQAEEFFVVFQPQLDLATQRLAGFEALVRWQRDGKVVPPDEFIAIAEETGQIVDVDLQVMDAACAQIMRWRQTLPHASMAVNVSTRTLMDAPFVDRVLDLLQRHQMPPGTLKLEVTETILMSGTDKVLAKMRQLVAAGVRFSIDDFGTGYSSLGYLKRFPFNQLKIDRSFINDMVNDEGSASLVRTIIAIGHNFNIRVIAEGAETPEQQAMLELAGCDEMQGYYYSRPLVSGDCEAFIAATTAVTS